MYECPREDAKSPDKDPNFIKLWEVCKNAHEDYRKTSQKSLARTKAAKFLRDTVENCIQYIEDKQSTGTSQWFEKSKLHALRELLRETMEVATKGSGGKPRRFDELPLPTATASNLTVPTARELTVATMLTQTRGDVLPENQNESRIPPSRGMHPPGGSHDGLMRVPSRGYREGRPYYHDRQRRARPGRYLDALHQHTTREQPRNRRRSASPCQNPGARRQVPQSEQSRDHRRQNSMRGYSADTYRPRY